MQVSAKINDKQLRQMEAGTVVNNADVEFNGMSIRQWIFSETKMTAEDYATSMRDNKWAGQMELWLLAKCLNTPIGVYVQPKKGMFTLQHIFQPVSRRNDLTEPIRLLFSNAHYDALVFSQKVQYDREIMVVMEKPIREVEIAAEIKTTEQHVEDIRSVM